MIKLYTKKGEGIIVDDEDYKDLRQYSWYLQSVRRQPITNICVNGKRTTLCMRVYIMRKEVAAFPKGRKAYVICRDGNACNLRKSNLVVTDCAAFNHIERQTRYGLTSSKYLGVRKIKTGVDMHSWQAFLAIRNKRKSLGNFSTEEAAALAYNHAIIAAFGHDDIRLNKLPAYMS